MCLRQLGWLSCRPGLAELGPRLVPASPSGHTLEPGRRCCWCRTAGALGQWGWRRAVATGGHFSLGCPSAPLLIFLPLGCAPLVEELAQPSTARRQSSDRVCEDPGRRGTSLPPAFSNHHANLAHSTSPSPAQLQQLGG